MNRTTRISAAVAAVSAAAVLPLGAFAVGGSGPSACTPHRGAVAAAQNTVDHDQAALGAASKKKAKTAKAKAKRQRAVARATTRLARDEAALARAQAALIACQGSQPVPTVTATTTATATATTTATTTATATVTATATAVPTVPAYGGKAPADGTTLFPMTNPDGTTITSNGLWDGTTIVGSGYGSGLTPDTADGAGWFYGITDRGPNVGGPDGVKMDPVQGFQPAIGKFHLENGHAELAQVIGLTGFSGAPMNGLVPPDDATAHGTGSDIEDQYGAAAPHSANGIDSESVVVDPAGGFYVSDEYGPYIVHLDATGKETYRYSPYVAADPFDGTAAHPEHIYPLPSELIKRKENKGMEGLTLTPDGKYLVGIMQSPLDSNKGTSGTTAATTAKGAVARIVKVSTTDHSVQEYLYALHFTTANNPTVEANSEITALDATHFVVDERDGCFEGTDADDIAGSTACPAASVKDLWKIDLTDATDVGPHSPLLATPPTVGGSVATVTYHSNPATPLGTGNSGLNINGQSVEDITGASLPTAAVSALQADGITTVDSGNRTTAGELFLNYAGLVDHIDAGGRYFGHDKVEGVAIDPADPNVVYLADDSDFGITDVPADAGWPADSISHGGEKRVLGSGALKLLPGPGGLGTGAQDFGEIMKVDLAQIPAGYRG
ncbi:esterase-like activity of phytase family protein [Nocardioides sp. BP30]|uniref:esterase-like activity of phytase family protein n=1 Tax=Nocardioides sp. BP30 TaxID=3036374 RepID=UPI00246860F9|nr:esterase-like activity of phytase family protein [Nocardioides sp. BP30]WGL51214.1 esterase-like activity of phytase family protein [Nocardioides sp. BP30]